jgi:threonine dehydrogenase-like Zn-dependent dehydrogenase
MEARSLWHTDEKHSEILSETLTPPTDSLEIKSAYSAISLGTEKLVATGKVPSDLHTFMRVPYQSGNFTFPIKYGYSVVGLTNDKQWVHCMHPHQDFLAVSKPDAYFFSAAVNPKVATQLSNLETVINAIWMSEVTDKDSVLVCGLGSIGILLAQTLKEYIGAKVWVMETNSIKKTALQDWGFDNCSGQIEYDICFHVSASADGLQYCIAHTVTEGKIMELSWYGNQSISIQLGTHFHYKRLQLLSVQVSEIPIDYRDQHSYFSRKQLAENIMRQVDFSKFITRIVAFNQLPAFFEEVRNGKPNNDFITLVEY